MNIGVLGTGMVGNAIGSKLIQLRHRVKMGSRTANNEKAAAWVKANGPGASQGTFADAAAFGEILFNCTAGTASLEVLSMAGEKNLNGKILIDISNPLDFSKGMPPFLTVSNTDSLAEEIQRAYPQLKVVKTLNTMNCFVMVNPSLVPGDHNVFVSGSDGEAKTKYRRFSVPSVGKRKTSLTWEISPRRAAQSSFSPSGYDSGANSRTRCSTSELWSVRHRRCEDERHEWS